MKTLGKVSFCLAGLLAVCSVTAHAAMENVSNQISVRLGGAFPTSTNNFSDSAKTGVVGGLQYLRHISSRLDVGGQVDIFSFAGKDRTIVLPDGNLDANSDSMATAAEAVGRYSFRVDQKISPYLIAGVGAARFSQQTKGTPKNGTTWADTGTREERTVADDSSTGFALSFGLGAEMSLSTHLAAALEANWQMLGVDNNKFGTSAINFPSIVAQLGYRF